MLKNINGYWYSIDLATRPSSRTNCAVAQLRYTQTIPANSEGVRMVPLFKFNAIPIHTETGNKLTASLSEKAKTLGMEKWEKEIVPSLPSRQPHVRGTIAIYKDCTYIYTETDGAHYRMKTNDPETVHFDKNVPIDLYDMEAIQVLTEEELVDKMKTLDGIISERTRKYNEQQEAARAERQRVEAMAQERMDKPQWSSALIFAELREDDSDPLSDYFNYKTVRRFPLMWVRNSRNDMAELKEAVRKSGLDFLQDLIGGEERREHRFYLGRKYHGWNVGKYTNESDFINAFKDDEFTKVVVDPSTEPEGVSAPEGTFGGIQLIDYSDKSVVLYGEATKQHYDRIKPMGVWSRFWLRKEGVNNGKGFKGWVISKSKLDQVMDFLHSLESTSVAV